MTLATLNTGFTYIKLMMFISIISDSLEADQIKMWLQTLHYNSY